MTGKSDRREFDRFASDYTDILNQGIGLSGYDSGYFDEYKVRTVAEAAKLHTLPETPRILNFGCGTGRCERLMVRYFPGSPICSTDISGESIAVASRDNAGLANVEFAQSDGVSVPFDGQFDILFCAGVFHHIPVDERAPVLTMLKAKLAPGGRLFVFEHNPLNPLTRRVVDTCPLDRNAVLIGSGELELLLRNSGYSGIERRYIVFFPRWLNWLLPLEQLLASLPLGAQYFMTATTGL